MIYNDALQNLNGLTALQTVGGYFSVTGLGSLANITGVGALTSVGGMVTIESNSALTGITGFRTARYSEQVAGSASTTTPYSPASVGFAGVTTVSSGSGGPGNVQIYNNQLLKTITGFSASTRSTVRSRFTTTRRSPRSTRRSTRSRLSGARCSSTRTLRSPASAASPRSRPRMRDINIHDNGITTLAGFGALTDVNGSLDIVNNKALCRRWPGLSPSVKSIGSLLHNQQRQAHELRSA